MVACESPLGKSGRGGRGLIVRHRRLTASARRSKYRMRPSDQAHTGAVVGVDSGNATTEIAEIDMHDSGIHDTAEVSPGARIGRGTRIWHQTQVRDRAVVGDRCILGKAVYVDESVTIGDDVKVQNGAQLFHGVTVEDGAFVGPGAILTNDRYPRSVTPSGVLKGADDWTVGRILVERGASIGAGAVILPDVTIGRWALVGAGAVVTRDVPPHGLVVGNPARLVGRVCRCGRRLKEVTDGTARCSECDESYRFEGWESA